MRRSSSRLVSIALAAMLLLSVPTVPGFASASTRGPVPNNAYVGSTALKGLSEAAARSAILRETHIPRLATLKIRSGDATYTLNSSGMVIVDVDRMLSQAYANTTPTVAYPLMPEFAVKRAAVTSWVGYISRKVDRKPRNAAYKRVKSSLVVVKPVTGRALQRLVAQRSIARAVNSAIGGQGSPPVVGLTFTATAPKITLKNLGKAILINQSTFRLRLYNGSKIEKTYRCAVGRAQYPTPVGLFKVVSKVKNPSWHNPGSAWAANMPAVIGPGPNNPLGLAALYLSAPGIRIHGVPASELGSIGSPASHGCIRLSNHDALDIYPRVAVGTPVYIIK